jgi:hypothetical protein
LKPDEGGLLIGVDAVAILLSLLPISVGVLTVDAFLMSILDPSLLTDSPPEEVDAFLNILLLKYEFVYLSQKLTSIDPVVY